MNKTLPSLPPLPKGSGWRRVLVVLVAMLLTFVALLMDKLTPADFQSIWNIVVGGYLGSDAAEKTARAWSERGQATAASLAMQAKAATSVAEATATTEATRRLPPLPPLNEQRIPPPS